MLDAETARRLGFSPYEGESDEDLVERAEVSLSLMSARPVTLRDYCDLAVAFAGGGARVTGREVPGRRYVELTVYLPRHRRLFAWQRQRVRRRVRARLDEAREINFVVVVAVP